MKYNLFPEMKKIAKLLTWAASSAAFIVLIIKLFPLINFNEIKILLLEFIFTDFFKENTLNIIIFVIIFSFLIISFIKSDTGKSIKIIATSVFIIYLSVSLIYKNDINKFTNIFNKQDKDTIIIYRDKPILEKIKEPSNPEIIPLIEDEIKIEKTILKIQKTINNTSDRMINNTSDRMINNTSDRIFNNYNEIKFMPEP